MNADERRAWGPLIREARKAQGLDQQQLADMAKTTRRTVGSIERGDTVAQREVLKRILAVLGLSEQLEVDRDVEAFLAMLAPLLQRLSPEERADLMPRIVTMVAEVLRDSETHDDLADRRNRRKLAAPARTAARKDPKKDD